MKSVTLFHNPNAGSGQHSKDELIALIEKHGLECRYYSTRKEGYKNFKQNTDLIVAAGGDGTVSKALKRLITRQLTDRFPIAVLALGTANNISMSLGVNAELSEQVNNWNAARTKQFDLVKTTGDVNSVCFESVGFGALTELIVRMKGIKKEFDPQDKLKFKLTQLAEIVANIEAKEAKITIDDKSYSGKFIWIEIMNICSIGPNIVFSPRADAADGELNIVLIKEDLRSELLAAIERKIHGNDQDFAFETIRATKVKIHFEGSEMHIDDQFIDMGKPVDLGIKIDPAVFTFLV